MPELVIVQEPTQPRRVGLHRGAGVVAGLQLLSVPLVQPRGREPLAGGSGAGFGLAIAIPAGRSPSLPSRGHSAMLEEALSFSPWTNPLPTP